MGECRIPLSVSHGREIRGAFDSLTRAPSLTYTPRVRKITWSIENAPDLSPTFLEAASCNYSGLSGSFPLLCAGRAYEEKIQNHRRESHGGSWNNRLEYG